MRRKCLIDSTAYPHLIEKIIANAPSVSALIAWRRTCRRYRTIADERLFAHAILQRRNPPPRSKWGRLQCLVRPKAGSNAAPFYNARRNGFELVVPPTSRLVADRNLPFYPWKVHTIDVDHHGEYDQASFVQYVDWDNVTMAEGAPKYHPHVLRRFGSCTADYWDVVHDTTVDYLTIGQDQGACDYTITMPCSTTRYILHLACPPWCQWPMGFIPLGELALEEVTIVLASHTPPIGRTAQDPLTLIVGEMVPILLMPTTTLTIVGLEAWTPVEPETFHPLFVTTAMASSYGPGGRFHGRSARVTLQDTLDRIVYVSRAEWWTSLGDRAELLGMWPPWQLGSSMSSMHA